MYRAEVFLIRVVVSSLPNTYSVCHYPGTMHMLNYFILAMYRYAGLISTLNPSSCLQLLLVVVFNLLKFSLSICVINRKLVISKDHSFHELLNFPEASKIDGCLLFFLDVSCSLALSGFSFTMYDLDSIIKAKKRT